MIEKMIEYLKRAMGIDSKKDITTEKYTEEVNSLYNQKYVAIKTLLGDISLKSLNNFRLDLINDFCKNYFYSKNDMNIKILENLESIVNREKNLGFSNTENIKKYNDILDNKKILESIRFLIEKYSNNYFLTEKAYNNMLNNYINYEYDTDYCHIDIYNIDNYPYNINEDCLTDIESLLQQIPPEEFCFTDKTNKFLLISDNNENNNISNCEKSNNIILRYGCSTSINEFEHNTPLYSFEYNILLYSLIYNNIVVYIVACAWISVNNKTYRIDLNDLNK